MRASVPQSQELIQQKMLYLKWFLSRRLIASFLGRGKILDFEEAPLYEGANEFIRRNRTKILTADEKINNFEITAKMRSSNFGWFVELWEIKENIQVRRNELSIIILRRGSD